MTVTWRRAALEQRFPEWVPRRLDELLDAAAQEFPDRPYVITDERTWTYREMREWSVRVARGLVAAGVRPGEHVALVMANHPEFVALKFGIARAGAVCVPVNVLNRRDELGYVLRQSDAVLLITMARFRDLDHLAFLDELDPGWERGPSLGSLRRVVVFGGGRPGATTLDELAAPGPPWEPVRRDPHEPADVLYTSGTTGEPKGVLLSHDMLLRTAYGSAFGRAFEDGRRITFSLPLYHVYGYVEGMLAVLFVGGAIVPQLAFDPAATLRAIERHRATDALFIPAMTAAVLDELGSGTYDIPSLRSVISSGTIAPTGLWPRIEAELPGVEVTTGYGMSEVTASSTVTRPDDPPERRASTNGRLRDVGVAGGGARLVEYRVVDPVTRADVAPGEVGELLARGPGVTPGYYRKPDETAAAFADGDGWLRTGDLGRIDPDDYLTLVGRVKETYRCGGEQVMPKEVEDALTAHPAVAAAHVVPLRDDRMGEVGVAYVVLRSPVGAAELIAYAADRLARFKVPRHVVPISAAEIPTTPSGRPRKFLLARRAATDLAGDIPVARVGRPGHPSPATRSSDPAAPIVGVLRRFCVDWLARADADAAREILSDGYTVEIGGHTLAGRDEEYLPATLAQLERFPGLAVTVHDVVTDGDRVAMRFTEHGRSAAHGGAAAAWTGIGLWWWDGARLARNVTEEDYHSRRRQLAQRHPDPVDEPAPAPWATIAQAPDPAAEAVVRTWLAGGDLGNAGAVLLDDGWTGRPTPPLLDVTEVRVTELFSVGAHVAFHVIHSGRYLGGLPDTEPGATAQLSATGLVRVESGRITGHAVRDRAGLRRTTRSRPAPPSDRTVEPGCC